MTASSSKKSPSSRRVVALGVSVSLAIGVAVGLGSCSGKSTSAPAPFVSGGPATPLSTFDVNEIIVRAVLALDAADMQVAVTDRTGDILGVYSTTGTAVNDGANIAVSLARTTSYFSNSQAPLSSRTVETLGRFHFPPTFASELIASQVPTSSGTQTVIAPTRRCTGVAGTPQGPLWQINATNRGATINAVTPFNNVVGFQAPPFGEPADTNTANLFFNPSTSINGTDVSPGITLLPGAVPLYKPNANGVLRLVGGVGVYVNSGGQPDVDAAEFAAIEGASGREQGGTNFFFDAIPLEGAITIVGVLLPYVKQLTRPAGFSARVGGLPIGGGTVVSLAGGREDPFGYLMGPIAGVQPPPIDDTSGGLSQANVRTIIAQVVASANLTRGQVRLPLGSSARVIATIVDVRGRILAHYRMEDTLCDAIDVVPAKARSTVYYCRPGGPFSTATTNGVFTFPFGDGWDGFPVDPTGQNRGIALTTRTLGFLSQPFYPPGIGGTFSQQEFIAALPNFTPAGGNTAPGPLYQLALLNQLPTQTERWGNETADPGFQNGLTFFPGSVPLYKPDAFGVMQLVGALGVSGDGVEQNDLIAFEGGRGFEPPPELRIDNFEFDGVKLPYVKFPESPR